MANTKSNVSEPETQSGEEKPPVNLLRFPQPLFDRIIVEPLDEKKSEIIVEPERYKDKPQRGRVVATGPGARSTVTGVTLPMSIKVGMQVLFTKYVGTEVLINGKTYLVMHETDVHYVF